MASSKWRMARDKCSRLLFAIRHSLFALMLLTVGAPSSAEVQMAEIPAHPALWTIHSKTATVYLFGSLHLLPPNLNWHTPTIDRAMNDAGTFYFEVPLDAAAQAEILDFVQKNGTLPAGTTLRSMLDKPALEDYLRACTKVHISPDLLDHERPWLAALALEVGYLQQLHYMGADGVDQQVLAFAKAHGRTVRAFETPREQLELFMPKDKKLELAEFEIDLRELQTEEETIGAMVDAWGSGNAEAVGRLVNKSMEKEPKARAILLDNRNRNWIKSFDKMLAGSGVTFVTVGTGHLVGPHGVPALLRARGYSVEGP